MFECLHQKSEVNSSSETRVAVVYGVEDESYHVSISFNKQTTHVFKILPLGPERSRLAQSKEKWALCLLGVSGDAFTYFTFSRHG